jgi:hypothetical protein
VDASLPAGLPLEVLDRVGDVNRVPIDSCFFKGAVQKLSGWTDEWLST